MSRWDSDAFSSPQMASEILADLKGGELGYLFHPLFGWRPRPNIRLKTIQTNEFGLRSRSFSGLSGKRGILIGGSFSWGYGTSGNEKIPSYLLEDMLRSSGSDISIINLAEQMFASPQQISSFIFSVDELKPDYVICVTGYNDTSQGFRNIFKNHPQYQKVDSFLAWGNESGVLSDESNLRKIAKLMYHRNAVFGDPYGDDFTYIKPEQEIIPLKLTGNTVNVIEGYCLNNNIKVAFVLEPLIYSKKHRTDSEKGVIEYVGQEKQQYFEKSFEALRNGIWDAKNTSCFIDSNEFIADEKGTIFFDDIHMSDHGYRIWTEGLYCKLVGSGFFA